MTEITERLRTAIADRYKIEQQLGAGGMATVYLAHDLKHDRKVAVKVLRPELAAVIGAERFLNEIKVTANLQHPHILPLHDSGEVDGFLFYVMPYVEGESLRDTLEREKQLGIEEAIELARAVAAALDYAHRHDVIHRDIKPENILIHDGQALVADFGIALAVTAAGGHRLTETGLSLGTPQYMSPEQAMGDREVDARTDVYSLGCVLYEMLTGDPPYMGSTAQAIVAKVITEQPSPVTSQRGTVPPHVAAAVHKSLAKLPADRFHSAAEFAEAVVRPGAVELPAAPHVTTAVEAAAPPARRDLRLVAASAIAVLAAALAVWGWLRPSPPPHVARFTISLPPGQEIIPTFSPNAVISPDGSRLVYLGPAEGAFGQLWLRPIDQLEAKPIPGTEGAFAPFFLADGQTLGFFVLPPALKTVSLAGGPPLTLTDSAAPLGGDWGPDGEIYFTRSAPRGERGISRIPVAGGRMETVTTPDSASGEESHRWIDVLPDGKGAVFTTRRQTAGESDIAVVSFESGEVSVLLRGSYARYSPTGHLVYARADGALLAVPFDPSKLQLTGPATPLIEGVLVEPSYAAEFTLSDNGTLIYVAGEPAQEVLAWVERDGRETIVDPDLERDFEAVALSPDGRLIALSHQEGGSEDVWTYDLEAGTFSRLTFDGQRNDLPTWTPDGSKITFTSNRAGRPALYTQPADGSGPAELLVASDGRLLESSWSRDGKWLVFRRGPGATRRDILHIRPGVDSTPQTFLATEADETDPKLSPDGRWLAYASDETGRYEVYVRPFPGPGGRWLVSTDGGNEVLWAHSGRELFYRNPDDDIVVADVRTEPTFSVGRRRILFPASQYESDCCHTTYDISPDDQRFLMIKNLSEAAEIVIVLNWFEELQERTER